jgi:hypothetical protein
MRPVLAPLVTFLLVASTVPISGSPQAGNSDILGPWAGAIQIMGAELKIRVVFSEAAGVLAATIDVPQQGATGLKLTGVRRDGPSVHFELPAGPGLAVFDGKLAKDTIAGEFIQAGTKGTFSLARGAAEPPKPAEEPPPYREEEVTFANGDVKLAGTLTIPPGAGPFPAVIMLTGSGAQNRDEELFGFKPFRVIADHLSRRGIAVLRYDDRGVGGSTGAGPNVTTEDFARDAMAALGWLSKRAEIRASRIGMLGHSEGGLIASMAASRSRDISFIVMLAGTAVKGELIIRAQAEAMARAAGATPEDLKKQRTQQDLIFAAIRTGQGWEKVIESLRALGREQIANLPEAQRQAIQDPDKALDMAIQAQLAAVKSGWYKFFIDYDPAQALAKVACPVLALFGSLDLQVPAEMNRKAVEAALAKAGNRDATVKVYDGANHLFIKALTGSPTEYGSLDKTFVPGLLDEISGWILTRTK